ncbi:MAG: SusF/SusE family outer membrane protein [Eudoraea sp.]|nr:SusF/SusE family outer membrane protein [Eudoraea sp.]
MFKFFNSIRHNLLIESKFSKYVLYAVGEIILLLIGILLALQINSWNTKRASNELFEKNIEQVYNSLQEDQFFLVAARSYTILQHKKIMSILNNPDTLSPRILAATLFSLHNLNQMYGSETHFLIDNINFDPQNEKQKSLVRQISNYTSVNSPLSAMQGDFFMNRNYLYSFLEEKNIPVPVVPQWFQFTEDDPDPDFYTPEQLQSVQTLVRQDDFKAALLSLATTKINQSRILDVGIEDGQSILALIQNNYPSVKLIYDDLGIIGDALPTGWEKSVPMVLTDPETNIWELQIELAEGSVKFRNRDSWNQNWGGTEFPEGAPVSSGPNIKVEAGTYKVIVNLKDYRYSFEKLN